MEIPEAASDGDDDGISGSALDGSPASQGGQADDSDAAGGDGSSTNAALQAFLDSAAGPLDSQGLASYQRCASCAHQFSKRSC